MDRRAMLDRLRAGAAEPWDVVVIGGGATGLSVAVDAATRGYRTVLLERGDFAGATSSRSTKLIHGGLRYLQQGRCGLVREGLRERARLLRNAPHLVRALPFLLPAFRRRDAWLYRAGLKLYDLLAMGDALPPSRGLSRAATVARMPTLRADGLRGAVEYHDAGFDDARLAVTLARTAVDHGAAVLNYATAERFLKGGGRVCGVALGDAIENTRLEISARVVINATGVFSDETRRMDEPRGDARLQLSQGAHIVLDASFLPGPCALIIPRTSDGRVLFAIPWMGRTLVGTTDTPVDSPQSEPRTLAAEIEFLLDHAARYLSPAPTADDILSTFAGLRPLVRSARSARTATLSRSHRIDVSASGLVTIAGGKWTTCRQMAEDTVDCAARVGGLPRHTCRTRDLRLHGWCEASATAHWSACYGADAAEVRALCDSAPDGNDLLHPRLPFRAGEVRWAARREMAQTVADVLSRRTRALVLDARAAAAAAPRTAAILAAELARDESWARAQTDAFRQLAAASIV